jgi:hypothetical protein
MAAEEERRGESGLGFGFGGPLSAPASEREIGEGGGGALRVAIYARRAATAAGVVLLLRAEGERGRRGRRRRMGMRG